MDEIQNNLKREKSLNDKFSPFYVLANKHEQRQVGLQRQ